MTDIEKILSEFEARFKTRLIVDAQTVWDLNPEIEQILKALRTAIEDLQSATNISTDFKLTNYLEKSLRAIEKILRGES